MPDWRCEPEAGGSNLSLSHPRAVMTWVCENQGEVGRGLPDIRMEVDTMPFVTARNPQGISGLLARHVHVHVNVNADVISRDLAEFIQG